ncbi:PEROXISOMAL MEMBRANE PROTEIN PEX14 [Salix koriyanagi]|uniref:Peroxisomal membrane protein PEX14 n=1 Tax=Salix koriyanagi TaxID=2511006 RepID=A0A9Q1ABQ5_9ROSI|nr:PEROXISOMAL MEMBRANE PROTEIN PEX14 [Salix koriyanagi]
MANQSSEPPPPSDPADQNPGNVQPTNGIQQDAEVEAIKQSPPSVFVNSEPMREEQVQNAVKFLSHPKVRGSPVMYRRSFLEKKGLTKEEIDEAFSRVPDPAPSTQATSLNQAEGQVKLTPNVQPPASAQTLQPVAAAPTAAISSVGTLTRSRFHWYHAVFAVGLLAASGAGTVVLVKNTIIPRLKSWIRKVVLEEEDEKCEEN